MITDGDDMSDVMHAFRVTVRGRDDDGARVSYSGTHWTTDGNALFTRFRIRYPFAAVDVRELPRMRWDD